MITPIGTALYRNYKCRLVTSVVFDDVVFVNSTYFVNIVFR